MATTSDTIERAAIRTELGERVSEMNADHQSLIAGDLGNNLKSSLSNDIYAAYFNAPINADTQIKDFLADATTITQISDSDLTTNNTDLAKILTQSSQVLNTLEQIVSLYGSTKRTK